MNQKVTLAHKIEDYKRLGIKKEPAIWEDGIRTNGQAGSFEWWYFDAEYKDGTKIVVVFYTKDGFDIKGPACPTIRFELTMPDGKSITKLISEKKGSSIRASKEKCDVKIDRSSIEYADGKYLIHFVDDNIEYRCTMKSVVPMWRPNTGHMYFGEKQKDFFAWFVAQPSAEVAANLTVDGERRELVGNGYHDHNWGNAEMNKLINHWYWCRANIGPYTVISCDIIAEKKYGYTRQPIIMIAKDGQILEDHQEYTKIERKETINHPFTKKFMDNKLNFIQPSSNNTSYQIEYQRQGDIVESSLLERMKLSLLQRTAIKVLKINPTYVRCIGTVTITVNEDGKKEVYEQEGLWEQMFFSNNKDAIIHE
ncbi:hypothetical protein [Paenibacillus endoradicis]|uniref:hypothetical protein n=1 Tax=Paenibacillus endoradicis TaxID=2972487 RepID=UPI0021594466|nr:hypothetical protein [Paenibacillus endoradicis]MCR8658656.1 hypothetical protein [Paenibacillus endoradicis]